MSSVALGPLSLVIALGGVACGPVVAGSIGDPPAETGTGTGTGTGAGDQAGVGPIVKDAVFNGSGCRDAGSASFTAAPEGGAFTITYASMALAHPPGPTYQHLNCAGGITLEGMAGRRLTVTGSANRGVAHLPPGASGKVTSSCSFAGMPRQLEDHGTLNGVYDAPFAFSDSAAVGSSLTSPCGEGLILDINTSLDLTTSSSAEESASMEATSTRVSFRWEAC